MSTWYKTGTVDVTNGSTTVTGTGTAWSANAKVGEEFRLSAGQRGYEIIAVVSDTELTIAPAYTDPTQTGQNYVIVPVRGILKSTYDALQSAIAAFNGYLDGPLSGLFGAGTAGAPGIANEGDTDTGMHWPAPGEMAVASNGADVARFHPGGMELTGLLSGTSVTQSDTDDTTGRVLRTDHGYSRGQLRVVSGTATLSDPTDVGSWLSSGYAFASVALSPAQPDADYAVHVDLQDASDMGSVGSLEVYDRATNGFKIRATGSATDVDVNWTLIQRAS